jgi:ribosomal peptide maturation radical SAM protein 1
MSVGKTRADKHAQRVMVSLVSMPFKDLRHPPIQLGILERCLERAGISARSHAFELAFMEHLHNNSARSGKPITIDHYNCVATRNCVVNLGDWVFKAPPYAEPSKEDEEYLSCLRESGIAEEEIEIACRMKSLVPEFLEIAADEIISEEPRIVGFSTVFQQNVASLALAKILKARDPAVTIIFGGDNCDGPMGSALHESFPWVDVVVRGEGERVLVEVASDVLANRQIRAQEGLCCRIDGRSVTLPQAGSPSFPIEDSPIPSYDDYFERLTRSPLRAELWPEVAMLVESSRGCWWGAKYHCTFCGLNDSTMKFRSKSAVRVADEMLHLATQYKVLDFVAVDDIIDLNHIRDLLPLLSRQEYDLTIFYETKANLRKDQIYAFKSAGVRTIQPGIESLSTPILRLMRKGVTALMNIRLLKWCAEIGVTPAWNLLYGFPDEPPEEYERMADMVPSLVHLEAPYQFGPVQVQRFSPYFENPERFGLEVTGPKWQYRFLYAISPEALGMIAYHFDHQYVDGRNPAAYSDKLREAVQRWQERSPSDARSLFYRRGPGFIIVFDRRPGFDSAEYRFDGAAAKIYLGCDSGATANALHSALLADGDGTFSVEEIEEYLNELVKSRLMYREGDLFLSLAIAYHKGQLESDDQPDTPAKHNIGVQRNID